MKENIYESKMKQLLYLKNLEKVGIEIGHELEKLVIDYNHFAKTARQLGNNLDYLKKKKGIYFFIVELYLRKQFEGIKKSYLYVNNKKVIQAGKKLINL